MEFHKCLEKAAQSRISNIAGEAKDALKETGQAARNQLPSIVGGLGASMAVSKGVDMARDKLDNTAEKADQYWNDFVDKYPEYSNDEEAREYFDVMMETNPTMAKHPVMVKSFLKSTYDHADAVNPDMLRTLSSTEKNIAQRQQQEREQDPLVEAIESGTRRMSEELDNMEPSSLDESKRFGQRLKNLKALDQLIDEQGHDPNTVVRSAMSDGPPDEFVQKMWNDKKRRAQNYAQEQGLNWPF